jgi:hypothetical protein
MSDRVETKKSAGRRTFLVGLLTGAGAAAVSAAPRAADTGEPKADPPASSEPVLYHRTEDTNRYYRTLYR